MIASFEQESFGENKNQRLTLTRANAGFTGTAKISLEDSIEFDDILFTVTSITHTHQIPHGDKAPTTTIRIRAFVKLSDEDVETLRRHGFR